jgi:hypothetical protein
MHPTGLLDGCSCVEERYLKAPTWKNPVCNYPLRFSYTEPKLQLVAREHAEWTHVPA